MKLGDPATALVASVLALVAVGLTMVYSTTVIPADRHLGDPTYFFRRQALFTALAVLALVLAAQTDYRALVRWRGPILAIVVVLLIGVLFVPGKKGATRWYEIGSINLQPSELAKVAVLLYVAGHCAEPDALGTFRRAAPAFAAIGGTVALILLERDLGTSAFVGIVGAILLLVAGVKLGHAALVGLPAIGAAGLYAALHFDHVRTRIEVFLDPHADPLGKGWQIQQSLIAIGSGGALGRGIGESRQKLFFLPDDHTDFILAIVGEEMGLLGTLLVLGLFAVLIVSGIRIAARAQDRLGFLLAFGVTAMIGLQAVMNIAVVTASMPTKGISLPFVSYGGSSLLMFMAAVGLLLNVAAEVEHA